MRYRKVLIWTGIAIGGLISLLLIVSVVVIVFGITINLDAFRKTIETAATDAIGREVRIEGATELTPTLQPVLEIKGFIIANPRTWEPKE